MVRILLPSACRAADGWCGSRAIINLAVPGRAAGIPVNKFVLEKAGQHILVLYWYQNDRNVWAQEFQGKLRLLPDLIKYKRSDVSLVRLVQPCSADDANQALRSCKQFTKLVFPGPHRGFPPGRLNRDRQGAASASSSCESSILNPCGQMGGAEMSLMDLLVSMRAAEPRGSFIWCWARMVHWWIRPSRPVSRYR